MNYQSSKLSIATTFRGKQSASTKIMATLCSGALLASSGAGAAGNSIEIDWRYQDAQSKERVQKVGTLAIPDIEELGRNETYFSDKNLQKTLWVKDLAEAWSRSIKTYGELCEELPTVRPGPVRPSPRPRPRPPVRPWPNDRCVQARQDFGKKFLKTVQKFEDRAEKSRSLRSDKEIVQILDHSLKLASNMQTGKAPGLTQTRRPGPFPRPMPRPMGMARPRPNPQPRPQPAPPSRPAPRAGRGAVGGGGMNLTAGGAQDIKFILKQIGSGFIPLVGNYNDEGFFNEFTLNLEENECKELICLQPAIAVEKDTNKLYLQLGLNSNVTAENFKRRPVNLSLVIDVSGSMQEADGTGKTRLDWAKVAAKRAVEKLSGDDRVSIVAFDSESEVLLPPTLAISPTAINAVIDQLETRGSTNVHAGLSDGYTLVSDFLSKKTENRVILLTDANLNTGETSLTKLGQLVSNYANEGIGLTAIGIGLNFNQSFIHQITQSPGGNYLFAQTGKQVLHFFNQFDFLVSPVAYHFKAKLKLNLDGLQAKLIKAYGFPGAEDPTARERELMNVRTLFFAGPEGGGALLLEYILRKRLD